MTYRELKGAVEDLGFETGVENISVLVSATNRALAQIGRQERPLAKLTFEQVRATSYVPGTHEVPSEGLGVRGENVRAVLFETKGKGTYTVRADGESGVRNTVATDTWRTRRYLAPAKRDIEVVFEASGDLFVRHVAFLPRVPREGEGTLPSWSPTFLSYDLTAFVDDFVTAAALPCDGNGDQITGAFYDADRRTLFLPEKYEGDVAVDYRRRVRPATIELFESGEEPVDIREDIADLLPLLVASFVWLDDEPTKAQYYKALYDEQLQYVRFGASVPKFTKLARKR